MHIIVNEQTEGDNAVGAGDDKRSDTSKLQTIILWNMFDHVEDEKIGSDSASNNGKEDNNGNMNLCL